MVDYNGYPTEGELGVIEEWKGTPLKLAEYVSELLEATGYATVAVDKQVTDVYEREVWVARYATGGWSGAEEILDTLKNTMFHHVFWESSKRGGLVIYWITEEMADVKGNWGKVG